MKHRTLIYWTLLSIHRPYISYQGVLNSASEYFENYILFLVA